MDIEKILQKREGTHGDFGNTAICAQKFKGVTRYHLPESPSTHPIIRESLDMICTKIARIVCGNPLEPDHWHDMAGYSILPVQFLEKQKEGE